MPKTADQRAAEALSITPDLADRDAIAKARYAVAQEIRRNRVQMANLAGGACQISELAELVRTMGAVLHRLEALVVRIEQLDAMAAGASQAGKRQALDALSRMGRA